MNSYEVPISVSRSGYFVFVIWSVPVADLAGYHHTGKYVPQSDAVNSCNNILATLSLILLVVIIVASENSPWY